MENIPAFVHYEYWSMKSPHLAYAFKEKSVGAARLQASHLGHDLGRFYHDEKDPSHLLSCCRNCGHEVRIYSSGTYLAGPALTERCEPNALEALAARAWMIGQVASLLVQRFQQEIAELSPALQEQFEDGGFWPGRKMLLSRDGIWGLQWKMRENPDEPISDENRQSAGGIVTLERLVEENRLLRAVYTGPRLNPNGHEDRERWTVLPLETGEEGFYYYDAQMFPRFRREDGIIGYHIYDEHVRRQPTVQGQPKQAPA